MSPNDFSTIYRKSFTVANDGTSRFKSVNLKNFNLNRLQSNFRIYKNKYPKVGYLAVIATLLLLVAFLMGTKTSTGSQLTAALTGNEKLESPAPLATKDLNKTFKFPLYTESGRKVSEIDYTIENANLQDAFIYQGNLAKAVKGRTFLIFNLKITNPYSQGIEINAKDYVRVKLNGSNEQLAPEIHNDPVQIQANSTKYTRIGLPINETDKDIILLVGELNSKEEKQTIDLKDLKL